MLMHKRTDTHPLTAADAPNPPVWYSYDGHAVYGVPAAAEAR